MTKLLLIDKDQTLIRSRLGGDEYVQFPWDQIPIPGVEKQLSKFAGAGWKIIVCSNQGGVDAGKKSLESATLEMIYLMEILPQVKECLFCPDYAGEICYRLWGAKEDEMIAYTPDSWECQHEIGGGLFRKPNPGMLKLAIHLHSPDEVIFAGDRDCDRGAAEAANIPFLWRDEFLVTPTWFPLPVAPSK